MIDPVTKSYLRWKGFISLTFNVVVHLQRKSGRTSSQAEIWRQELVQKALWSAVFCLDLMTCSAYLLITPRSTSPGGTAYNELDTNQENTPQVFIQ